jgi:hypothetical protein
MEVPLSSFELGHSRCIMLSRLHTTLPTYTAQLTCARVLVDLHYQS